MDVEHNGESGSDTRETRRSDYVRWIAIGVLLVLGLLLLFLWDTLGDDEPDGHAARNQPVRPMELAVDSEAVGQRMPVTVVVPGGAENDALDGNARGALVFLHGRGADQDSILVEPMFAALRDLGDRAPVLILPYGGESSYYHSRDGGDWPDYLVREVLDVVGNSVAFDRGAVAFGGISMGGFGALNVARLHPDLVCAAGAHSPALFMSAAETAPGAFDDADDFAEHDLVTMVREDPSIFGDVPLWVDIGEDDSFLPGATAFIDAVADGGLDAQTRITPGGHDARYWNANWADYLGFYADQVERCRNDAG